MKRIAPILISFLMFLFITGMVSTHMQATFGLHPVITSISMLVLVVMLAGMPKKQLPFGVQKSDVNVEMWVAYIIERLRKDNSFMAHFYDDSRYSVGGRIVHIPQPGAKPVVRKNRSTYPATAVRRTDTDVVYVLDEYSTDPTHITNAQENELSYDMQDSILGDHMLALGEDIADDFIVKILNQLPSTNIVVTSGASAAAKVAGQTGNRKVAMPVDLKTARLKMDLANVPKPDRYALLESNMLDEITSQLNETQANAFNRYYDPATGIIGRYEGFNIMDRSSVNLSAAALSSNKLVPNELGAAAAATDQVTSLLWQKNCAAKAVGEIAFFANQGDALFQGDVYSALCRAGGRRRRADDSGVIALRQANGA